MQTNGCMKRWSTPLIIRQMQMRTTERHNLTPVRMAIIQKITNNKFKIKKIKIKDVIPFYCWAICCIICHIFIHPSIDGQLSGFYILAIVDNAAVNIGVHISFQISVFVSFGLILESEIPRSHGSSIFNFLRHLNAVFHSGCINLHSHHQCKSVLFSSQSLQIFCL